MVLGGLWGGGRMGWVVAFDTCVKLRRSGIRDTGTGTARAVMGDAVSQPASLPAVSSYHENKAGEQGKNNSGKCEGKRLSLSGKKNIKIRYICILKWFVGSVF